MAVVTDPAHLVLEATGPENVDTVVVDGRILKRGGKLLALDIPKVIAEARAALAGVRERKKWRCACRGSGSTRPAARSPVRLPKPFCPAPLGRFRSFLK